MTDKLTLTLSESDNLELAVLHPSVGNDVIDVKGLAAKKYFTFDPGFLSTAACESKITYIDGDNGILLYRGYPIEQLAEKLDFPSVCYLLLFGEIPTQKEYEDFSKKLAENMALEPSTLKVLSGFDRNAHPMAMTMALVSNLAAQYHPPKNKDANFRINTVINLIAKIPTIAAVCYRHNQALDFIEPDSTLSYAENFLHMMYSHSDKERNVNSVLAKALDRIFTLHADHEQNASTSTVRLAGSTGSNPYAAMVAGIAALWGPAHGGANEACLKMFQEIGSLDRIPEYIRRAKDKNDTFRLMGFGHRVYKNYDPRAKIMRETCYEVLEETGASNNPLLQVAIELERIALEDEYFVSRKLYPNVDFYSGITLSAIGIPMPMFTVIFALGRMAGWASHWNEMMSDPELKIGRPRQLYTGYAKRDIA